MLLSEGFYKTTQEPIPSEGTEKCPNTSPAEVASGWGKTPSLMTSMESKTKHRGHQGQDLNVVEVKVVAHLNTTGGLQMASNPLCPLKRTRLTELELPSKEDHTHISSANQKLTYGSAPGRQAHTPGVDAGKLIPTDRRGCRAAR